MFGKANKVVAVLQL